jgi:hypothetical protein
MRSLFYREVPRGEDVAAAIRTIVAVAGGQLPLAISKLHVLAELMVMSATKEDGEVIEQSASAKKFVEMNYWNTLTESSIFQSGYERYEDDSGNPVVPVTEYFFRYIHTDDTRACLDTMRQFEIQQSLPKRPSVPLDANQQVIHTENEGSRAPAGKVGKIAGVVIYKPRDADARLLFAWLDRKRNVAIGQVNSVIDNLGHTHGERAVLALRSSSRRFQAGTERVLPGPAASTGEQEA